MNFFRRKNRHAMTLTISDQTKSSRGSLSSSDGKSSVQGSTGTLRNSMTDDKFHNGETVQFKENSSSKGSGKFGSKIKHARFSDDTNSNNNSSEVIHDELPPEQQNGTHKYIEAGHTPRDMALLSRPGPNFAQDTPSDGLSAGAPISLYSSVIKGDKAELKKILTGNPELLNTADNFGRTPLMYCVLADRLDCAKYLISMGCDLDQVDNAGRGATHSAAHKGSYKFLELLHNRGASLDIKDNDGQTPLHLATRIRTPKCLEFLLKRLGPGMVDIPDAQMRTALHWGAAFNNTECVKLLIKYGINIALTDGETKTPLHWAANNHDPSTVPTMQALLERSPSVLNWQDSEGRTALHFAVAHGNSAAAEFLVNFKAVEFSEPFECDPDRSDYTYRTPLHWAAQLGHTHIVKLLLQGDAKISSSDGNGATPFLYAALSDKHTVVEAMIEHDPKVVDQADIEGRNALMWAAGKGSNNVMRIVLGIKKPAQPEEGGDKNQAKPVAAEKKEKPALNFTPLDVNKQDNKGNTALHVAARNGHGSSVELLLSRGARHDVETTDTHHTPIFGPCEKGQVNCVKYLLDYGASIYVIDSENRTPLHWAALGGHAEVCELLINEGLDVDVRDKLERTPLHCAAFGGFINCMNMLLENGANVDLQDQEGRSALHWAAQSSHLDAIKLLFQYSVFPNPMEYTEERLTPLDHALQKENEDVMHYLIEQGALSAEHIRNIAAMRIQAYYRGHKVRKGKEILMKTLLLRKEKREKIEAEEKSAEQVRNAAAIKIQAFYRGCCTRRRLCKEHTGDAPETETEERNQKLDELESRERDKSNEKPNVDSGSHSPEQDPDLRDVPLVPANIPEIVDRNSQSHDEGVICDQASVTSSSHSSLQLNAEVLAKEKMRDEDCNNGADDAVEEVKVVERPSSGGPDAKVEKFPLPVNESCEEPLSKPADEQLPVPPTIANLTKRTGRKKLMRSRLKVRPQSEDSDTDSSKDVAVARKVSSALSLRSSASLKKQPVKVELPIQKTGKHRPTPPPHPKETKTRKKMLFHSKPNFSSASYPELDKIGNIDNIQGERVEGIAYKPQPQDTAFYQDEMNLIPECPVKIRSETLAMSEYIEGLMTMSPEDRKLLNEHQNRRRDAFKAANYAADIIQKAWLGYLEKRNPSLHRKFALARKKAPRLKKAKKHEKTTHNLKQPFSTGEGTNDELVPPESQFEDGLGQLEAMHSRAAAKQSTAPSVASSSATSIYHSRSPKSDALRSSLMSSSEVGSSSTARKSSKTRRSKNSSSRGSVYVSLEKLEELSRIYGNPKLVRDLLAAKGRVDSSLPSIGSSTSTNPKRPVTVSETPRRVFESSLRGTSAYTQPKTAMHSPRVWTGLPNVERRTRLTATPSRRNHSSSRSGPSRQNVDYRLMPLQWQKLYGELQDADAADAKRKRATRFSYNLGEI